MYKKVFPKRDEVREASDHVFDDPRFGTNLLSSAEQEDKTCHEESAVQHGFISDRGTQKSIK